MVFGSWSHPKIRKDFNEKWINKQIYIYMMQTLLTCKQKSFYNKLKYGVTIWYEAL